VTEVVSFHLLEDDKKCDFSLYKKITKKINKTHITII
jgi:hypothetical protein